MRILLIVIALGMLGNASLLPQTGIISKDIAPTLRGELPFYELVIQIDSVLKEPVTPESKKRAYALYITLVTFTEIWSKRGGISSSTLEHAYDYLNQLVSKFSLEIPPGITSIRDIFIGYKENGQSNEEAMREIIDFALHDNSRPLTQTEAFLSRSALQKEIFSFTADFSLKNYKTFLKTALMQERTLRSYDVFYHAQSNFLSFYQDILAEIIKNDNKFDDKINEFEYVRAPQKHLFDQKLSDLLAKGFKTDREPEIRQALLSVNLSLFSSLRWGEFTLDYFFNNISIAPPFDTVTGLLKFLSSDLGIIFKDKYIGELAALYNNYLTTKEGSLLQIFIPRDKVNNYVYLSLPYGKPLSLLNEEGIDEARSDQQVSLAPLKVRNKDNNVVTMPLNKIDSATYLDVYRNRPHALQAEDMNLIQGRILITNDFLLNPKSGVKMFRYTTIPPEQFREYKEKLLDIVKRMTED